MSAMFNAHYESESAAFLHTHDNPVRFVSYEEVGQIERNKGQVSLPIH